MPELCRFLGIVIRMFYEDHNPPHFHAVYGKYEASFSIDSLELISGEMPPRVKGLIIEWATLHQKELMKNWKSISVKGTFKKIDPLV